MISPRETHTFEFNGEKFEVRLPSKQTIDEAGERLHDICHKVGLGVGLVQLNNLIADAKYMHKTILELKQKL